MGRVATCDMQKTKMKTLNVILDFGKLGTCMK